MLAKLEAKGVIRHRAEGLRYVYSPVTSRTTAQKKAIGQLMRVFFGGSPSEAATALLKHEQWSDGELDALRAQIDQVRKQKRRS
jgi:predicted transcriptional regulator